MTLGSMKCRVMVTSTISPAPRRPAHIPLRGEIDPLSEARPAQNDAVGCANASRAIVAVSSTSGRRVLLTSRCTRGRARQAAGLVRPPACGRSPGWPSADAVQAQLAGVAQPGDEREAEQVGEREDELGGAVRVGGVLGDVQSGLVVYKMPSRVMRGLALRAERPFRAVTRAATRGHARPDLFPPRSHACSHVACRPRAPGRCCDVDADAVDPGVPRDAIQRLGPVGQEFVVARTTGRDGDPPATLVPPNAG